MKTKKGTKPEWLLNKKAESDVAENLFYVFVLLDELNPPQYHVVPRRAVAEYARKSHKQWLATPGKAGKPHKDNDLRQFADLEGTYKDRWDLLSLD